MYTNLHEGGEDEKMVTGISKMLGAAKTNAVNGQNGIVARSVFFL